MDGWMNGPTTGESAAICKAQLKEKCSSSVLQTMIKSNHSEFLLDKQTVPFSVDLRCSLTIDLLSSPLTTVVRYNLHILPDTTDSLWRFVCLPLMQIWSDLLQNGKSFLIGRRNNWPFANLQFLFKSNEFNIHLWLDLDSATTAEISSMSIKFIKLKYKMLANEMHPTLACYSFIYSISACKFN